MCVQLLWKESTEKGDAPALKLVDDSIVYHDGDWDWGKGAKSRAIDRGTNGGAILNLGRYHVNSKPGVGKIMEQGRKLLEKS